MGNQFGTRCYYCGKESGQLIDNKFQNILNQETNTFDVEPCIECKDHMKDGIIVITVEDNTSLDEFDKPIPNPVRTGQFGVVTEDFVKALVTDDDLQEEIIKSRYMFMEDSIWTSLLELANSQ